MKVKDVEGDGFEAMTFLYFGTILIILYILMEV